METRILVSIFRTAIFFILYCRISEYILLFLQSMNMKNNF